jgi:hypothetical protein
VHIVFVLSVILSLFHFVFLSFCHPPKTWTWAITFE